MSLLLHVLIILVSAYLCQYLLQLYIARTSPLFLDVPNSRSSHSSPKPTAGGIVFVILPVSLICFTSLFMNLPSILYVQILAFPLALVGLFDDYFRLPIITRLIFQTFTAFFLVLASPLASTLLTVKPLNILCLLTILLSIVAFINFANFMDGLDGLLAGSLSIAILFIYYYFSAPLLVFILIGSLFGFLSLNWSPSQIFMGDVGSTYLVAVFAGSVLQAPTGHLAFETLFLVTPLIADPLSTLLRRYLSRQPLHSAHRMHLYQRLHQAGWSHASVSSLYISATALIAFSSFVPGLFCTILTSTCVILLGIYLDRYVANPYITP